MGSHINEGTVEVLGTAVAQKTMQAGAAAGIFGWLAQINWIGLCGVVIALVGMLAGVYFQWRRDRREQAESQARIDALRESCGLERKP